MTTEHQRIARIRTLFERPNADVSLGIGDDCAVLAASSNARVWTVDAAVENVHFSRSIMTESEIGYRAFMAATSDIAAMGACATAALSALLFPASFSDDELDGLLKGLAEASDALGVPVVGGNLARASELSLTTTVLGECQRPVTRASAQPGDGVFVSGSIGGAALGLCALRAHESRNGRFAQAIEKFLRPRARLDLSAALAQHASAAIDISDGLAQDLGHLCCESKVAAVIELERIPRLAGFADLAHALEQDPLQLTLAGGEDYELLFTAKVDTVPPSLGTLIGFLHAGSGMHFVEASGREIAPRAGFDHFR